MRLAAKLAALAISAAALAGCETVSPHSGWALAHMTPQERARVQRQHALERAEQAAWARTLDLARASRPVIVQGYHHHGGGPYAMRHHNGRICCR